MVYFPYKGIIVLKSRAYDHFIVNGFGLNVFYLLWMVYK